MWRGLGKMPREDEQLLWCVYKPRNAKDCQQTLEIRGSQKKQFPLLWTKCLHALQIHMLKYVEALTTSVTVFGAGTSKAVIKVKLVKLNLVVRVGPWSDRKSAFIRRDIKGLSPSLSLFPPPLSLSLSFSLSLSPSLSLSLCVCVSVCVCVSLHTEPRSCQHSKKLKR